MTNSVHFESADPLTEPASTLIDEIDVDTLSRYPGLPTYGIEAQGFVAAGGEFVIAYADSVAIACGALRPLDGESVEVKRLYVRPGHRGKGIARAMLTYLEDLARSRHYSTMKIETGDRQPEAIGLYKSAGYTDTPVYGPYIGNPHSLCFVKTL